MIVVRNTGKGYQVLRFAANYSRLLAAGAVLARKPTGVEEAIRPSELKGDDLKAYRASLAGWDGKPFGEGTEDPVGVEIKLRAHKTCKRTWAARLTGVAPQGLQVEVSEVAPIEDRDGRVRDVGLRRTTTVTTPFQRELLTPDKDERSWAGTGDLTFVVGPGIYETEDVQSSTHRAMRRRYWRVTDGAVEITKDQAIEELTARGGGQ